MSDTIDQIIDQQLPDAPSNPAGTGEPGIPPNAIPENQEESPFNWGEFLKNHPDLEPVAKSMQGDYTRKTQELANERKQYEGLTPEEIAEYKALKGMSPEQRADYYWEKWSQEGTPSAEDDPLADYVPKTDEDAVLYKAYLQQQEQLNQITPVIGHYTAAQQEAQINQAFTSLATQIGREIPDEERAAIEQAVVDSGAILAINSGKLSIAQAVQNAYRLSTYDQRYQDGVNEGSKSLADKAGLPSPPAGITPRNSNNPQPQNIDEIFDQNWRKAGLPD